MVDLVAAPATDFAENDCDVMLHVTDFFGARALYPTDLPVQSFRGSIDAPSNVRSVSHGKYC